jgi:hypothetical protein
MGGVYKWCREQVFFLVKLFTLQEVTITFWCTVDEKLVYFNLQSTYIINDVGAASGVMKTSGNKKMQVTNVD